MLCGGWGVKVGKNGISVFIFIVIDLSLFSNCLKSKNYIFNI